MGSLFCESLRCKRVGRLTVFWRFSISHYIKIFENWTFLFLLRCLIIFLILFWRDLCNFLFFLGLLCGCWSLMSLRLRNHRSSNSFWFFLLNQLCDHCSLKEGLQPWPPFVEWHFLINYLFVDHFVVYPGYQVKARTVNFDRFAGLNIKM